MQALQWRSVLVAGIVLGSLLAGCSSGTATPSESAASDAFQHVHGVGVDPQTGSIFVATHGGVFEIPDADPESTISLTSLTGPIAGRAQDTMGFTMADGRMWGSGHPDPAELDTSPTNLGLIASDDAAKTWQSLSLSGEVDFHDIAVTRAGGGDVTVFGYSSSTGTVSVSADAGLTWSTGATIAARDLTATDQGEVFATTADGVVVSTDRAATFTVMTAAPALYLIDALPGGELVGVDTGGVVWTRDASLTWVRTGSTPGEVEALTYAALPRPLLVVAGERSVSSSTDSGATWSTRAADVDPG